MGGDSMAMTTLLVALTVGLGQAGSPELQVGPVMRVTAYRTKRANLTVGPGKLSMRNGVITVHGLDLKVFHEKSGQVLKAGSLRLTGKDWIVFDKMGADTPPPIRFRLWPASDRATRVSYEWQGNDSGRAVKGDLGVAPSMPGALAFQKSQDGWVFVLEIDPKS
jgi:hypothetical protein